MIQSHLLAIILVIAVTAVFAYQASYLKNKRIFRLTLFQILYMVLIPGIIAVLISTYTSSITSLPMSRFVLISDSLLKNVILLAILFTYGGQCVHIVTKTLSEGGLRDDDSEIAQLNKYLHLNFSHNLVYCGVFLIVFGLTLLELNHSPAYEYSKLYIPIIRGVIFGIVFIVSMYRYTQSKDEYSGRWADLKASFLLGWICTIVIAYAIQKMDPNIKEYQLLLPSLLGFAAVNVVNLVLVLRHVKNRHHN